MFGFVRLGSSFCATMCFMTSNYHMTPRSFRRSGSMGSARSRKRVWWSVWIGISGKVFPRGSQVPHTFINYQWKYRVCERFAETNHFPVWDMQANYPAIAVYISIETRFGPYTTKEYGTRQPTMGTWNSPFVEPFLIYFIIKNSSLIIWKKFWRWLGTKEYNPTGVWSSIFGVSIRPFCLL